ncbi:MAG: 5'-nucleotidase C-terminal domain-containing protein [Desulfobacterales bacterium]|nr:5'-nucleotidase C-terminal domain-containing protein [Desulfobacterales bacterium]
MKKKNVITCAVVLILWTCSAAFGESAPEVKLTLLHLNDQESQLLNAGNNLEDFGGAARAVALVKKLRSAAGPDAVITISAGDNFLIGPEFKASLAAFNPALKGVDVYYDARALDVMEFDAIIFGNHDFDFGPGFLKKFIATGFNASAPRFLSANLDFSGEPSLQNLAQSGRITGHLILEKNGHQFGIIGATTPSLPYISKPGNIAVEDDVVAVVQNEINALLAKDVNKIIFVSHLQGLNEDKALISELSGIDIAVAGGSNAVLANPGSLMLPGEKAGGRYPILVKDLSGRDVPLVTTGGEYRYIGRLMVSFDAASGEITRIDPNSGPVRVAGGAHPDAVLPDPYVQAGVTLPVQAYVNLLEKNVIARSSVALNGKRRAVRSRETNMGDLVADSILAEARRLAANYGIKSAVVALINGGGIRNNAIIRAGNLTERNTYDIAPFANFLTVFEDVPVATFKDLLENAVSRIDDQGNPVGSGTGRFAQIAGFSLEYDSSRQAMVIDKEGRVLTPGKRVTQLYLDDGTGLIENGRILVDPAFTLTVATTDFLARGGDQYPFRNLPFTRLSITYQGALNRYIRERLGGVIRADDYPVGGNGRIVRRRNPG